ncbi:hypothetical protein PR048_020391 [Dryococelus australis]|uniref:Uncharacterized protein n=1 Tax=Dryococelus australis TaxID=614101 RepID=A0ABQ9H652_9NEOP|nr:hypothetical protein PR048_020391 [Dryococelus australis]
MVRKKEHDFLITTLGSEKRLSYTFFWQYFNENYSLGFGQPVKDAYELNVKIKRPFLNENAMRVAVVELLVHKHRARKFYITLRNHRQMCEGAYKNCWDLY